LHITDKGKNMDIPGRIFSYFQGVIATLVFIYISIFVGIIRIADSGTAGAPFIISFGERTLLRADPNLREHFVTPLAIALIVWALAYNLWSPILGMVNNIAYNSAFGKWYHNRFKGDSYFILYGLGCLLISYSAFSAALLILPAGLFTFSLFPLWHLIIGILLTLTYFVTRFKYM
jgi:hypothetical protein